MSDNANPNPPALDAAQLAAIQAAIAPIVAEVKALANTKATPGFTPPGENADKPTTSEAKNLALDVEAKDALLARVGWKAIVSYLDSAQHYNKKEVVKALKPRVEALHKAAAGGYLAVNKAGAFLSTFEDGGALWSKETVSGELIEFLRASSAILSIPGLPRISGYGGKLTISKETSSSQAYWEGEGQSVEASSPKVGNVVMGSHKLMGRTPISNDIMRLGTGGAAVFVGRHLQSVMGERMDDAMVNGSGAGKPRGLFTATASSQKVAIAGTSAQNKVDDTLRLPKMLEQAFIPNFGNGVYLMGTATYYSLMGLRATDTYLFPELRNLSSPTLHGRPVLRSTKFQTIGTGGAAVLGYVVPEHLLVGEAAPLTIEVGESGDDFAKDMMTVRGIAYADFVMEYDTAAAWLNNLSY